MENDRAAGRESHFRLAFNLAAPYAKTISATMMLIVAWQLMRENGLYGYGDDYGIKAALFAFGAAYLLFFELVPNRRGLFSSITPWTTRLAGAVWASLAAWNWILEETGGEPFPLLESVALYAFLIVALPAVVFAFSMIYLWSEQH